MNNGPPGGPPYGGPGVPGGPPPPMMPPPMGPPPTGPPGFMHGYPMHAPPGPGYMVPPPPGGPPPQAPPPAAPLDPQAALEAKVRPRAPLNKLMNAVCLSAPPSARRRWRKSFRFLDRGPSGDPGPPMPPDVCLWDRSQLHAPMAAASALREASGRRGALRWAERPLPRDLRSQGPFRPGNGSPGDSCNRSCPRPPLPAGAQVVPAAEEAVRPQDAFRGRAGAEGRHAP